MFILLIGFTLDRFIAIKYPYKYAEITGKQVKICICLQWMPGIIFIIIVVALEVQWKYMIMIGIIVLSCATIVLLASNAVVYSIARRHAEAIRRDERVQKNDNGDGKKILKSTYVCLCVVSSFVVCNAPNLFHDIIALCMEVYPLAKYSDQICEMIGLLNAVMDPIFFVMFRKDVKKELKYTFMRSRGIQQNVAVISYAAQNTTTL